MIGGRGAAMLASEAKNPVSQRFFCADWRPVPRSGTGVNFL